MRRAFTLLEVLTSMAVFILLAGGIFVAVSTVTRAAGEFASVRAESERLSAFENLLRSLFLNLPSDARVGLRIQSDRLGDRIELSIDPPPALLATGGDPIALSAESDGKGAFRIALETLDKKTGAITRPIPLLPDIRNIQWRFAASNGQLQETWTKESGRPLLIRLDLVTRSGSAAQYLFLVPNVGATAQTSPAP